MESGLPDHKTNLIAFLFCRDIIFEVTGGVSPFRLIEGADVHIQPTQAGAVVLWQAVHLNVFMGVACYHMEEHDHVLKLRVTGPDGSIIGEGEATANPGGLEAASYRNIELTLPGHLQGQFKFELEIDGGLTATAFFYVKHVRSQDPALGSEREESENS